MKVRSYEPDNNIKSRLTHDDNDMVLIKTTPKLINFANLGGAGIELSTSLAPLCCSILR